MITAIPSPTSSTTFQNPVSIIRSAGTSRPALIRTNESDALYIGFALIADTRATTIGRSIARLEAAESRVNNTP
jgi:hypothetical protein